ncbi:transcription factor bhlh110 [Phtheirospermum japonicum]|uniref:Transcription factor bhlh110 n=1 Tax=Phtheirospermum japonicum TaxID=374723 RepID=A0A830CST8_9LAMI|nr:transcription factor bhlh110 [Phtheirospermum japonicum]
MESANNHHHHHQLQDHVLGSSSSSSSATPSYYGVCTTTHAWSTTPTSFLNTNNGFITSYNPSDNRLQENTLLSSQYNPNMAGPDLAFHNWANYTTNDQSDLHLPRIKEEFSDHYLRKYADLLNNNEQRNINLQLKSLSSENLMNKINNSSNNQISAANLMYSNNGSRGFSQIFPSINISNLNQMGLANGAGSNLDMNLEALDLLTSSSFSGNLGTSSQNHQIGFSNYAAFDDHMQQSHHIPFYAGASNNKVRKEKLGDRIASLQQLVAPFGKTDTASVLMEAIGYIKFLQDQVETLSVPYMKASRNKSSRIKAGHADHQNETDEESKRDLRSRGLCLVPLSCLSYITDGGAATVWPPPHFGGPT